VPDLTRHVAFDAYGTVFDVHSAARGVASELGPAAGSISSLWRTKQLEYTWIHAGLGTSLPFRHLTREALLYALRIHGVHEDVAPAVLGAYQTLDLFPDVLPVLDELKSRGIKLAILSNGDTDQLDELTDASGLKGVFDALISARKAGTFKPSAKVYTLATEAFGVPAGEITFVSSNRWDIAGATHFGFKTVWLNRAGAPDEYPELAPARVIHSLTELSDP
jgi:2-haloacid dehalogenase